MKCKKRQTDFQIKETSGIYPVQEQNIVVTLILPIYRVSEQL